MGVSAEQVVVELDARTEKHDAALAASANAMVAYQSAAENSAARVETAISASSNQSGIALDILRSLVKKTIDQFEAGAPAATVLSEHIEGLAEAAEFAGGPMNLLGIAISSGLSLALAAVLPLLINLGSELLGSGEKAETADKGLKAFEDRQASMARFIDASNGKLREQSRLLAEVGVGDKGAQAAQSNSDANAYVNQAFAAARSALAEAPGQGGRTGPTRVALELSRAISDAGSNVQTLRRNIDALSGGGEVIETLKGKVGDLAGRAAESAKQAQSYSYQQNTLNASLRGAVEVTLGVVESQARHATATTALARAQANLADVEARKQSIEKMDDGPEKTAAILQYGRDQITATQAVQAATEAEKQHRQSLADSKRAAAEAHAEAMLLAAAHAKLATATDEVSRAEAALAIVQARRRSLSPGAYQAELTQAEADLDFAKEMKDTQKQVLDDVDKRVKEDFTSFKRQSDDDTKSTEKDIEGEAKGRSNGVSAAFDKQFQAQEQGVRTLANLYQDLFQRGTKGIFDDFTKLGEEALAKLAAKETFALIGKLIGGAADGGSSGFLSGLFSGHDTGGSFEVGGSAGIDNNLLSVNGKPMSRVSKGETIAIIPSAARAQASAQQGAASAGGGTNVYQSFTLDARYGITTTDLLNHVNQTAAQAAVLGAHGGGEIGYQKVMSAAQRPQLPRSTG